MEQRTSTDAAVKKRLTLQHEILKRVEQLAERMQTRAEDVAREVRDLEERATDAERDLSGAFDTFRRLSDTHFVENVISEEDHASCPRDRSGTSGDRNIPAQSYEMHILPRYKEAVSLGLASYNNHMKKANKGCPMRSTFSPFSIRGPLPHIIGSEEYIHDNSCGLIEDSVFGPAFDFNDIVETKGAFADAEPSNLFGSNLFGMEQGPSAKNENEPLVSAAADFKAMLEAALRSPYKFYDEVSSSHDMDPNNTWIAHTDQITPASHNARIGSSSHLRGSDGSTIPICEGNLNCVEGSDIHTDDISALISGSLFDAEETTQGGQEQPDNIPELVEEATCDAVADQKESTGSTTTSPMQKDLGSDNGSSTRDDSPDTAIGGVQTGGQESSSEVVDGTEEDIKYESCTSAQDNVIVGTKSSTINETSLADVSKENFMDKLHYEESEISGVGQDVEDVKGKDTSQLPGDVQR